MGILDDAAKAQSQPTQPQVPPTAAPTGAAPQGGSILDQAAAQQAAEAQTPAAQTPPVESTLDRWKREAYETIGQAVPQAAVAPMQGLQTHLLDKFHQSSRELGNIAESKVNTALAYGMDAMDDLQSDLFDEKKQPGLSERAGVRANDPLAANKMRAQFAKENPWIAGATGGVSNLAGQVLGDPTNWPFLAKGLLGTVGTVSKEALKPWAEKLMSKGFGIQMTAGVASQLDELANNWSKMSDYDKSHAISQVIAGTYMAQSAVRGGFQGEPKAKVTPETVGPEAGGEGPKTSTQTGTEQGEQTTLRPTTQTTAGVEAPVTAKAAATLAGRTPSILERAADQLVTPSAETQFGKERTAPAATRQAVSTVGQVAEDRIAQHLAVASGEAAPETISGTQQPSKFVSPDEAWQEMQKTAQDTTFRKADDISQREQADWEAKRDDAIREYKDLVDRHNANIDDYNAQVPKDQQMPHAVMNPAEVAVPERPLTYNELRADVQTEQANTRSQDAAVREEALKTGLPKAEKAMDNWFKQHADEISPAEYDSVRKLWSDSERMKEIAMGLRGPLTKGNLTGNQMRQVEVSMNNRQLRRGQSPDAFQRLLGPEGYNNWQNVAKLFDQVKDPTLPEMFTSWGKYAGEYLISALIPHLGLGPAVKWGMEKLLNHVMFDPEFGQTFGQVVDWLKSQHGRVVDSIKELPTTLRDKLVSIIKSNDEAGERGAIGRGVKQGRTPQPEKFGRKGLGGTTPTPDEAQVAAHEAEMATPGAVQTALEDLGARPKGEAVAEAQAKVAAAQAAPKAPEPPPQPIYIDRQNGTHEVVTGPASDRTGYLLAKDVPSAKEGEPSTEVRVASHWVDPEQRGKGFGAAQLETLAHSLADTGKTALLSDTKMTDSAKGSWKRLMANYPLAVTETPEGYRFDLEKLKSPAITKTTAQVKGSTVELMKNPLPVKTVGSDTPSTLDVAKALNKYTKRNLGALQPGSESAEMVARATELAEDEARYQLAQNNSGTTWYTEQMDEHDKIAKEMRPALTDDTKLSIFKFAEAILSSGQKPYRNFTATMEAWDHYARDGKFPISNPATGKSWGPRNVISYGNAFEAVNRLIEERGEKGAVDWMMSEHPVSELKQYNKNVSGKKTDLQHGVQILGEKRGPFAQNLHGQETAFTADMWVSRTWNRWMGTIEVDPESGEITSDSPRNQQERGLMKQSFSDVATKLGLTTSSLQAVLWYYEQALYTAHGTPKESWSFSDAAARAQAEEKAKGSTEPAAPQAPVSFGPRPAQVGSLKNK